MFIRSKYFIKFQRSRGYLTDINDIYTNIQLQWNQIIMAKDQTPLAQTFAWFAWQHSLAIGCSLHPFRNNKINKPQIAFVHIYVYMFMCTPHKGVCLVAVMTSRKKDLDTTLIFILQGKCPLKDRQPGGNPSSTSRWPIQAHLPPIANRSSSSRQPVPNWSAIDCWLIWN